MEFGWFTLPFASRRLETKSLKKYFEGGDGACDGFGFSSSLDRWIDRDGNLACFTLMVIFDELLVMCDCTESSVARILCIEASLLSLYHS